MVIIMSKPLPPKDQHVRSRLFLAAVNLCTRGDPSLPLRERFHEAMSIIMDEWHAQDRECARVHALELDQRRQDRLASLDADPAPGADLF